MYSKKMNEAVQSAQKCIDNCCRAGNISVKSSDDIGNFFLLAKELDPKNINFQSGNIFATMKINSYQKKIAELIPSINRSIEVLKQDCRISNNTVKTLKAEKASFEAVLTDFRAEAKESPDTDLVQQAIVAENTLVLLDNTITEYEYLHKKINDICTISAAVFNHSLISSKISGQIRSSELGSAEYKSKYADLMKMILDFKK